MSRVTGLVRVAVLGAVLGTPSAVADAYDLANGTPNMIYELLLGGVLSSSLVPLFTRLHDERDEEGTNAVVSVAVLLMAAITAAAVLAAPLIFRLYSLLVNEAVDAGQYREVGTVLARMFLVQIFFYGLNTLATALLNARRLFFAAAWVPVLANIVVIISLLFVPTVTDGITPSLGDVLDDGQLRWLLGAGATAGIALMALALLPSLAAAGVRIRLRPDFKNPAVRTLRSLSGWALGYVAANQAAIVVIRNLLRGGDGSVFAYSRAYMWFVLPHGLLAMSIATTFLPELAGAVSRKDKPALVARSSLGIRLIAMVTMPAGFWLFVLPSALVQPRGRVRDELPAVLRPCRAGALALDGSQHRSQQVVVGLSLGKGLGRSVLPDFLRVGRPEAFKAGREFVNLGPFGAWGIPSLPFPSSLRVDYAWLTRRHACVTRRLG